MSSSSPIRATDACLVSISKTVLKHLMAEGLTVNEDYRLTNTHILDKKLQSWLDRKAYPFLLAIVFGLKRMARALR